MKDVLLHIEAIIFASEEGITLNELKQVVEDALAISISKDEITDLVDRIKIKYQQEDYILELKLINNAYQFLTKPLYHESVNHLQSHKEKKN